VIYTIKNRPAQVRDLFQQHDDQMCISSVTLGELIYGAERSEQVHRNLKDIEGLKARLEVASFDEHAVEYFGQLRAELYKIGKPIGTYDIMIAAHAIAKGLTLVSNNIKEFESVPGL